MKRNWCSLKVVAVWTCLAGLLLVGALVFLLWGVQQIINSQIRRQTSLESNTEQWERFLTLPFPISFNVRLFHVENPDDVRLNNSKANLTEKGPYKYNMFIAKTYVRVSDNDDSVSYNRKISFVFDESSPVNETDTVTIINPVLMAALQLTNGIERLAMAGCLKKLYYPDLKPEIFITVEVKKLLFDGLMFAKANDPNLGAACKIIRIKMLDIVKKLRNIEHVNAEDPENSYLRFAIFNYKTQSYVEHNPDGRYAVSRGRENSNELGNILDWNGERKIDTWGSRYSIDNTTCNVVRGTDSTMYRPFLQEGEGLTIFNTDICRSVDLHYKTAEESYKGINAFRYETSKNLFRPSTANPENDCFCTRSTTDEQGQDNCYLNGLLDIKPCIGSPILASQPHFLNAESRYRDNFENLNPDKDLHGIYLLLEPNTGTPLEARKRVQLNSVLKQQPLLSSITPSTMLETVFPMLWLEESVELPDEFVDKLNSQLFDRVQQAYAIAYALVAAVTALFTISFFFLLRKAMCNSRKEKI